MSSCNKNEIINTALHLCKTRGVRLTQQRQQVLEIISVNSKPMGAYEILQEIQKEVPKAAPPMIYRALDFLQEVGLVHKLETLHAYMGCAHPDHEHGGQFLICNLCGEVIELDDAQISNSVSSAAIATGFKPAHDVIEVVGTCSDCLK